MVAVLFATCHTIYSALSGISKAKAKLHNLIFYVHQAHMCHYQLTTLLNSTIEKIDLHKHYYF